MSVTTLNRLFLLLLLFDLHSNVKEKVNLQGSELLLFEVNESGGDSKKKIKIPIFPSP